MLTGLKRFSVFVRESVNYEAHARIQPGAIGEKRSHVFFNPDSRCACFSLMTSRTLGPGDGALYLRY